MKERGSANDRRERERVAKIESEKKERETDILAVDVFCRIGSQKSVDRLFLND